MNPDLWNPDWGYTFAYEPGEVTGFIGFSMIRGKSNIVGVLASCPYCGHQWVYKGGDKHKATCHGRVEEGGYNYICGHKVRLHPYLLKLREMKDDPSGRLRHNRGRTNRGRLKYPNKNYDHISEVRK